ncbi:MAG: inosine/xanthosine triphosphatase [Archaeoglobaceae archaeon]|nr:inosine/xanthosine triphosphatase [Archaeoglobaceae archaeon]MCX8151621.1 inosine/xanthosine triphosphatase [Archaeoglobaceae archaeon]MDW8013101.1 inosine/xanthosine triphosphatase [Archaeoglobaceae archaeon]
MKVAVGSKNPTKIEGVRKAFEEFFGKVDIHPFEVKTSIPLQPFNEQTILGAIERAKKCYKKDFNFSVGIEAGLFKVPYTSTGYMDFQVAAVYNGEKLSIGFGPGFEYPRKVVEEVLKGREVGKVMEEMTGIKNLGKKFGAIYYLSKGVVSRIELSRIAVIMALLPFISNKFDI